MPRMKKAASPDLPALATQYPQYWRDVSQHTMIDIHGICHVFNVNDPSGNLQQVIKKVLLGGNRNGGKASRQDIQEAINNLNRYLELNPE